MNFHPTRFSRAQGRKTGIASLMVALTLVTACGRQGGTSSRPAHDLGQPIRDANPIQWIQGFSDSQLDGAESELLGMSFDVMEFEDRNSERTKALNTLIARIDEALKARFPELKVAPTPVGRIQRDEGPNAFVMPLLACVNKPVRAESLLEGVLRFEVEGQLAVIDGSTRTVSMFLQDPCLPVSGESFDWDGAIATLNKLHPNCKIENRGNEIVIGTGCSRTLAAWGKSSKRFGWFAMSPRLTVTSGLLETFSYEEVVATILHEMGHYYRAHSTVDEEALYNYFFTHSDESFGRVPARGNESIQSLGQALLASGGLMRPRRDVEGQLFDSELFDFQRTFWKYLALPTKDGNGNTTLPDLPKICDQSSTCITACSTFRDKAEYRTLYQNKEHPLARFPLTPLPPDDASARDLYLASQRSFEMCANQLVLGRGFTLDGLSISFLRSSFASRDLKHMRSEERPGTTLLAALRQLENRHRNTRSLMQRGVNENIGFYTMEQEADDLSLEWLAALGLSPNHAVTLQMHFGQYVDSLLKGAHVDFTEVPYADCKLMQGAGFKDENGGWIPVPVARLEDTHHDSCYRAYNLVREISAHGLSESGPTTLERPANWSTLF